MREMVEAIEEDLCEDCLDLLLQKIPSKRARRGTPEKEMKDKEKSKLFIELSCAYLFE